jgi:chitinase
MEMDQMGGLPGPQGMLAFSAAAHAGGSKALFSIGGAGNGTWPDGGFAAAASATHRTQFVKDLLDAAQAWNFDGIDLDWEDSINWTDFKALVLALRTEANNRGLANFVLTIPIGGVSTNFGVDSTEAAAFTYMAPYMDQFNPMSYTMTGVWPGWDSWHFNPLYGHGVTYPVDVASTMAAWAGAGIPKAKLGVGLGFYGIGYGSGITAPRQPNPNAWWPADGVDGPWSHGDIMKYWYGKGGATYVWDDVAKAGYLSWASPFNAGNGTGATLSMLTYEDERSIAEKGAWAKANGYGGAMIWTINDGVQYPRGQAPYNNPLLDAVKTAFR